MSDKSLYFIAIIPPEPVFQEIWQIKKDFEDNYKSKAALNSPPHLTVHMPFKLKPKEECDLINELQKISTNHSSFDITLDSFGQFNEKVIYVSASKPDALQSLYTVIAKQMKLQFQVFNSDYKNRGYHPHITVAFRNLNKENFLKAWAIYSQKEYQREFVADKLALLKHNGKTWDVFKEFKMGTITQHNSRS